jgi:hypothetical protein
MLQQMIPTVIARLKEVNIFDKMLRKSECFIEGGGGIWGCSDWSHTLANPDADVRSWDRILYLSARHDLRIRIRAIGLVVN